MSQSLDSAENDMSVIIESGWSMGRQSDASRRKGTSFSVDGTLTSVWSSLVWDPQQSSGVRTCCDRRWGRIDRVVYDDSAWDTRSPEFLLRALMR